MIKLMEHKVYIRCLERDKQLVSSILADCITEFKAFIKKELDRDWEMDAQLDSEYHLELREIRLHKSNDDFEASKIHKADEDRKW